MLGKMTKRMMVFVLGVALIVVAAGVAVLLCINRPTLFKPESLLAQTIAEVRVKAVERKTEPLAEGEVDAASDAVAIVCGEDAATAERYEARNDALRSIARRRDLPKGDVAALMAYLRRADDAMRVELVAALKNDVMNLLRRQEPMVEGLAETLMAIIEGNNINNGKNNFNSSAHNRARDKELAGGCPRDNQSCFPGCSSCFPSQHPPVVIDYCIQHLGAMVNELDGERRARVRRVMVKAAGDKSKPYAGTALYSLAEDARATPAQDKELKGLALALCKSEANHAARIAAIQLAGERGYADALPVLRETLSAPSRDAVLDIAAIGSVGLLGNADDIPLVESVAARGGRRYAVAANAAIERIKNRVARPSEGAGVR